MRTIKIRIKKYLGIFLSDLKNENLFFATLHFCAKLLDRLHKNNALFHLVSNKLTEYETNHIINVCTNTIKQYKDDSLKCYAEQNSGIVWVFWWDGFENAPDIVKACRNTIVKYCKTQRIIFLDKKNISDYISLPEVIINKHNSGIIGHAHFSDVLRFSLLAKYGGLWLDATIYLTKEIPKEFLNKRFFTISCPDKNIINVSKKRWMGFFLSGHKSFILFCFVRDMLIEYWSKRDVILDYLLFDYVIEIAYKIFPEVKQEIDNMPYNNPKVFDLMEMMNNPYNSKKFSEYINGNTYVFKLGWHRTIQPQKVDSLGNKTIYGHILENIKLKIG